MGIINEVHWEITNRCNLHCRHCLPMSGKPRPNELSFDDVILALNTLKANDVSSIYFTGGEPFARHDFLDILRQTVDLGFRTHVITNSTLLDDVELSAIKNMGVGLGISIDGADPVTNDITRGYGSFEKIISCLQKCQDFQIPVQLYVAITQKNFHQLFEIAQMVKKYNCTGVHFNELNLGGRAIESAHELAISEMHRLTLPQVIKQITFDVFGEVLSDPDKRCWVDGSGMFMSSEGDIYLCVEVFQQKPGLAIGNIRSISFSEWLEDHQHILSVNAECCYGVQVSERVTFTSNISSPCILVARQSNSVDTLTKLYAEMDNLYSNIKQSCDVCQEPDCVGYVWVLPREVEPLFESGVPLLQANDGPTFIHSFPPQPNGEIDVTVKYPPCSQLRKDARLCGIHQSRPLTCRLYPIGLETQSNGTIVWALHTDCLFVQKLLEDEKSFADFKQHFLFIVDALSPQLLVEIIGAYREVYEISRFPSGENSYLTLKEVKAHQR